MIQVICLVASLESERLQVLGSGSGTKREDCASIAAISLSLERSLGARCSGRRSGQKLILANSASKQYA